MIDKITMYHMEHINGRDYTIPYKMFLRFIVQKSSYVISCLYEMLYGPERYILRFARERPDLEIISVASEETEQKIIEYEKELDEKELRILQLMKDDFSLKDAGAMFGVGRERARQILNQGCNKIKEKLKLRYNRESMILGRMNRSCGILALGKGTYNAMKCFKHITYFLAKMYHVREIYIEQHYAHSDFMMVLRQQYFWNGSFHITAVTDEDMFSESIRGSDDLHTRYCPPCDAAVCTGWPDMDNKQTDPRTIASIIERSDFCIFDSSSHVFTDDIRQLIDPRRQTVFLDIGKSDTLKTY